MAKEQILKIGRERLAAGLEGKCLKYLTLTLPPAIIIPSRAEDFSYVRCRLLAQPDRFSWRSALLKPGEELNERMDCCKKNIHSLLEELKYYISRTRGYFLLKYTATNSEKYTFLKKNHPKMSF